MIDAKLDEELAEYHKDQNIEELADSVKDTSSNVICGSIQSVALNLDLLKENEFD